MKNTFFCLLLVLCYGKIANGQNLVMNPSFEDNSGCPMGPSELTKANYWTDPFFIAGGDTCSTSDYYNTCNPLGGISVGVPANIMGNQAAHTGNGYAGFIVYEGMTLTDPCVPMLPSGWREYVQGQLTTPLVAGQQYCVSFWLSLADNVKWASDNFGVHLSPNQIAISCQGVGNSSNLIAQGITPQLIYSGAPVTTTNGWVKLQFTYIATGGEQYITIGNFYGDSQTNYVCVNSSAFNPYSYYFIDDVSVIPDICCDATFNGPSGLCSSDAPVTLTPTTPGGTWSGTGVNSSGVFNPATAGSGVHTITYTLSCGSSESITINVSSCNLQVCIETNGSLTVSGGAAPYTWQNETTVQDCSSCFVGCAVPPGCATNVTQWQNFATGTTIPAPSGYPIRVTDAGGGTLVVNNASSLPSCSSDPCATTTITINITPTNASCTNPTSGAAIATATGGTGSYTYSWNTVPPQSGASVSGLSAGNYTVTATDANGCTGTQSVTITQPSGFTVSVAGSNPACNGGTGSATATVTGGASPFTYVWSPSGGNSSVANNLAPGTYTVNVTDNSGCTSQGTIQLTAPPAINLTMSATSASCATNNGTASVAVTGGTLPYTYSWSPSGGTGSTTTPVGLGTYTVTVTDVVGCTAQNSVQVTENSGIVLTMNSSPTQCTTNTGTASVLVSGGTGPYTYSWSPSGGSNATTTPVGQGTYTVTVTDGTGCQAQNNVVVGVVNSPTISVINSQNVTCFGRSNGSAQVQATGGTTPYTFSWSPSGLTGATVNTLSPGTHTVTVTDHAGCTDQTQVVITQPTELIVADTITNTTCGLDDGEISLTVSGGTGGYTYSWTPNVSTGNVASNLPFGNYSVIVRDAQGCSDTLSLEVIPGTFFTDAYPETSVIDLGGSISLNVYVDPTITVDTFFWTPTTGLSCTNCLNPVASPTETTNYVISVISDNGCISTDTVTIIVIQPCGDVFVPNIFSPNGDGLNDLECVMGDCVTSVDFKIYNRWGETVFSSDSQANCWDGTFRGKPVQTGVYVYKLTATLNTGEQVLRSGNINVTR